MELTQFILKTALVAAHAVINLTAAVSGNAALVSFDSVNRLEQFSITVTNMFSQTRVSTTTIAAQDANDDGTTTSAVVHNLSPSTMYRFFVIVNARDQIGTSQSAIGTIVATTLSR